MEDEHFNFMLKLGLDRNKFPTENADSVDSIYRLTRPSKVGWRSYLMQRYRPGPGAFLIDRERIGIVLRRIVRGLFYHGIGMRLPEFVPFNFVSIEDQPRKAAELKDVTDFLAGSQQTIGDGKFRYAFFQCALPDPFVTAWLLTFYDHRRFFCFTSNPV